MGKNSCRLHPDTGGWSQVVMPSIEPLCGEYSSILVLLFCQGALTLSEDDPALYVVKFKTSLLQLILKLLAKRTAKLCWLYFATALDSRFNNHDCLPQGKRDEIKTELQMLVASVEGTLKLLRSAAGPSCTCGMCLLLRFSFSTSSSSSSSIQRGAVWKFTSNLCPLQWWKDHLDCYHNRSPPHKVS